MENIIFKLPNEILLSIFIFLNIKELILLGNTCKHLNCIIENDHVWLVHARTTLYKNEYKPKQITQCRRRVIYNYLKKQQKNIDYIICKELIFNKVMKKYKPIFNKMQRLEENIKKFKKEYDYSDKIRMKEYRKIIENGIQLYKPIAKNNSDKNNKNKKNIKIRYNNV